MGGSLLFAEILAEHLQVIRHLRLNDAAEHLEGKISKAPWWLK